MRRTRGVAVAAEPHYATLVVMLAPLLALWLAGASPSPSPSARSFTNDDLEQRRPKVSLRPASPSPSPSAATDLTSPDQASNAEREQRAAREREWRARFAQARAVVRGAEGRCWKTVIEPVLMGGNRKGYYVQQLVRRFEESEALRQARRALDDLEEELRRSGDPPGWARE